MNRFALLLLIPLANDPRPFSSDAVFAHDLGTLSPHDARRLHGTPARFRIILDSMESEEDGLTVVECGSADGSTRTA